MKCIVKILLFMIILTACSNKARSIETDGYKNPVYGKPYVINGIEYFPLSYVEDFEEEGLASWYGSDWHGNSTSSGEIYNMYSMTAAHKTLPLQSIVLVTNLENSKELIVRVNDRGPFVKGRIIDLSYAAAKEIGIADKGLAKVKLKLLSESPNSYVLNGKKIDLNKGNFHIQIGAFTEYENAKKLASSYDNTKIVEGNVKGVKYYRVRLTGFETRRSAELNTFLMEKKYPGAFVIAE